MQEESSDASPWLNSKAAGAQYTEDLLLTLLPRKIW